MIDPNLMLEMSAEDLADMIVATTFHVGEVNRNPYHLSLPAWMMDNVRRGAEAREGLYNQVPNPVRWADSIRLLASEGVTRFIEVGAGAVLTGLLRNINPSLQGVKFGEADDLEKLNAIAG